jgi:hypothetical protein
MPLHCIVFDIVFLWLSTLSMYVRVFVSSVSGWRAFSSVSLCNLKGPKGTCHYMILYSIFFSCDHLFQVVGSLCVA